MAEQTEATPAQTTDAWPVAVEQSVAIAVQDAADFLRATMTLAIGAFGAGTANFLATGDTRYLSVIDSSKKSLDVATQALTETLNLAERVSRGTDPVD